MVSVFAWLSATPDIFKEKYCFIRYRKAWTPNPSTTPAVSGTNWNNPWSSILLEKLRGHQLYKKFVALMETKGSLPHSQEPSTCPYSESGQTSSLHLWYNWKNKKVMGIQSNLCAWCFCFFEPADICRWISTHLHEPNIGGGGHKTLQITIYRQQRLDHYHTKCTVTIRDLLIRVRTRSTGNELQGPNLSEYPSMWLKAVMENRRTFTLGRKFKMEPPRYSALFTKQRRSVLGTFLTDILNTYHRLNATHFSETLLSSRMWRAIRTGTNLFLNLTPVLSLPQCPSSQTASKYWT